MRRPGSQCVRVGAGATTAPCVLAAGQVLGQGLALSSGQGPGHSGTGVGRAEAGSLVCVCTGLFGHQPLSQGALATFDEEQMPVFCPSSFAVPRVPHERNGTGCGLLGLASFTSQNVCRIAGAVAGPWG